MQRDSDLIRAILLAVEADYRCEILRLPPLEGPSAEAIHYHVRLLIERRFLQTPFPDRRTSEAWLCLRLTWESYDFLDHIRDPVVWRCVKRTRQKLAAGRSKLWWLSQRR